MNKSTIAILSLLLSTSAFAQTLQEKYPEAPVKKQAVTRADDGAWKDLGEGTYSDFVLSNLFVGYFNDPVTVQIQESTETPGVYRIVKPWSSKDQGTEYFNDDLNYLIVDASDPDYVMIPQQRSPVNDAIDGEAWYCSYTDWAVNVVGVEKDYFRELQPDKVPVLRDGIIKFSQNCMAVMYPNGTGEEFPAGTWSYSNMEYEGYIKLPGAEGDEEEWESLGTGKFLEGFFESLFTENYVPVEQDVEIMENKNVKNVYKVVKAFQLSGPTGRDLIVDARQEDFVRVEEQNTGINTTNGYAYILSCSCNGSFSDLESMIQQRPDYEERNITRDEAGIYFPPTSILTTFPLSGDYAAYINTNSVDSYILFPGTGIEDILNKSDLEASVEYYNLQGIRITSPRQGETVIARRGSKSTKMIIR